MKLEYDNAMLLEIIKAHVEDYEKNLENIDFIAIDGQTIDETRVVSFTIGSKSNGNDEATLVKTGDTLNIEFN